MQVRTNRRSSLSEPVHSSEAVSGLASLTALLRSAKRWYSFAGNELVQGRLAGRALHGARLSLAPSPDDRQQQRDSCHRQRPAQDLIPPEPRTRHGVCLPSETPPRHHLAARPQPGFALDQAPRKKSLPQNSEHPLHFLPHLGAIGSVMLETHNAARPQ
jgi:hypothetical protein